MSKNYEKEELVNLVSLILFLQDVTEVFMSNKY